MADTDITEGKDDDQNFGAIETITKQQYIDLTYRLQIKVNKLEAENLELVDRVMTVEDRFIPAMEEELKKSEELAGRIKELESQIAANQESSPDGLIKVLNCVKRAGGENISGEPFNVVNQVKALREFYDKHHQTGGGG